MYYKEAVGALVVFDVTRVTTFEAVTKWKNDIDAKVMLPDNKPIPVVLLANKVRGTRPGHAGRSLHARGALTGLSSSAALRAVDACAV